MPGLGVCAAAAVVPVLIIIWFTDHKAVRAVLQYGVPLPRRVASFLESGFSSRSRERPEKRAGVTEQMEVVTLVRLPEFGRPV